MSRTPAEVLLDLAPQLRDTMKPGPGYVMVCCPFHQEKTPSLAISLENPVWFCHGCKASGHIAQLLRWAGLSSSAINLLLPKREPGEINKKKPHNKVAAKMLYGKDPFRGEFILDEAILDQYRLAPMKLVEAGFETDTLRHFEVGFDTRNLNITFPLRNVYGELVGISGRTIIDGDGGRYHLYIRELHERPDVSLPENYSMESVKSSVLWHGHVVRPLFFRKNYRGTQMVITEGFKACMWTWQAGYQDVVALAGSYLTDFHAELISRVVPEVVLFLDNNQAGVIGTHNAIRRLLPRGVKVTVARYPDERQQPDDLNPYEIDLAFETRLSPSDWRSYVQRHEHAS